MTAADGPGGPTLLIVDDSAMMRAMIRRVAENAGVAIGVIREAANGVEALTVLEREAVDVLFTDINMPVMSGTELLQALRDRARWPRLVTVVVSTDGSDARYDEMQGLNVTRFVSKPFPPEVMRDVLVTAVDRL
jgi:two-component system chemotaxis response regulator CheY